MTYNLFILALYSSILGGTAALPQKELALEQTSCVKATNPNDGSSVYSHDCEVKARSKRDTEDDMFGYSFSSYSPAPKKVSEEEHNGNSIEGKFHDQQSEMEYDPIDEVYHHYPSFDSYDGYDDEADEDIEYSHFPSHVPFFANPDTTQPKEYSHETATFDASYPTINHHLTPIDDKESSQASKDDTVYEESFYPTLMTDSPSQQKPTKSIKFTEDKSEANKEELNPRDLHATITASYPTINRHHTPIDDMLSSPVSSDDSLYHPSTLPAYTMSPPPHEESSKFTKITQETIKSNQETAIDGITQKKPIESSIANGKNFEASDLKVSYEAKDPEEASKGLSAETDSTETEETDDDKKVFRFRKLHHDTIDWV